MIIKENFGVAFGFTRRKNLAKKIIGRMIFSVVDHALRYTLEAIWGVISEISVQFATLAHIEMPI